jgi:hypothetical protein
MCPRSAWNSKDYQTNVVTFCKLLLFVDILIIDPRVEPFVH